MTTLERLPKYLQTREWIQAEILDEARGSGIRGVTLNTCPICNDNGYRGRMCVVCLRTALAEVIVGSGE